MGLNKIKIHLSQTREGVFPESRVWDHFAIRTPRENTNVVFHIPTENQKQVMALNKT